MRNIIMLNLGNFKIEDKEKEMKNIINSLSEYLDFYPVSRSKSKYSVMGPVSRIIEMSKSKKNSSNFIKARTLRMHEMKSISGYISSEAITKIENAVDKLIKLRNEVSPLIISKIMDMIDYEVYFIRRKKSIEKLEKIRDDFIDYCKTKYTSIDKLKLKWNKTKITDWNDIKYPTRTGKYYKTGNDTIKQNIENFWKQYKDLKIQIINEEEEND